MKDMNNSPNLAKKHSVVNWDKEEANVRRERTPTTLHAGFGFGAAEIRQKSTEVARVSAEKKEARIREFLMEPVYNKGLASLPVANESDYPLELEMKASQPQVAPQPSRAPNSGTGLHYATSRLPSSVRPRAVAVEIKPGFARGFVALLLDAVVAVSAFVIALGANFALAPQTLISTFTQLLTKGGALVGFDNQFLIALVARVALSTVVLVFAGQLFIIALTGVSAGRYAMGISQAGKRGARRITNGLAVAFSEALSLGGMLTFPLGLLMSSRAPLAPWVRFKQVDS